MKNKKIAIIHPNNKSFVQEICDHFAKENEIIEVNKDNYQHMEEVLSKCDLAFFEWCSELLIEASQKYKKKCPWVCRLHSIELFGKFQQVNWNKVDKLILVSPAISRLIKNQKLVPAEKITVVNNLVNPVIFVSKSKDKTSNIGFIGDFASVKEPSVLLQCLFSIKHTGYSLHAISETSDINVRFPVYWNYFCNKHFLPAQVYNKIPRNNLPNFYNQLDFIVSTSHWEASPVTIIEAMLCGCVPLIHDWIGADELYPKKFIWSSIQEFQEKFEYFSNIITPELR